MSYRWITYKGKGLLNSPSRLHPCCHGDGGSGVLGWGLPRLTSEGCHERMLSRSCCFRNSMYWRDMAGTEGSHPQASRTAGEVPPPRVMNTAREPPAHGGDQEGGAWDGGLRRPGLSQRGAEKDGRSMNTTWGKVPYFGWCLWVPWGRQDPLQTCSPSGSFPQISAGQTSELQAE